MYLIVLKAGNMFLLLNF